MSRPGDDNAGWADAALALFFAVMPAWMYWLSAPAVVNLDGLGYIKLIPHNFAAGHLAYMPVLRLADRLCHGHGLTAGRLVSAVAIGVALATAYGCARALASRFAATLATAGLAVSYAVWIQGGDVEAYACGLAAFLGLLALALAYRASPSTLRAVNLGLALAGAVLFHLTHVLATPFVLAWTFAHRQPRDGWRRGLLDGIIAASAGGAVTLAGYAWACFGVRKLDLHGTIAWIETAQHGFHYEGGLLGRFADAVYGFSKAFVWSPYLYESNAQHLLGQFILGLVPVVALGVVIGVRRRAVASLPWRPLAVLVGAYTAMALAFFASDHERWLFVLPVVWLAGAVAVEALGRPAAVVGTALVAYLAVANAATAVGPAHNECWDRTRADAAAAPMHDGDLVLFPGHSWDEYIGFYTDTKIVPFPIAYYAGRDGNAAMQQRLAREVSLARARHAAVWVARVLDDSDVDPRGFYELQQLGLDRAALKRLLAGFVAVKVPTVEPQVTVWRLDPR